ncbi:ABC transporter permease [Streptomyces sp. NPDC058001]|uniref:ABC transporter permease n=1 Tax=Streptomyces sp. NPDC058001 TaxID=3346300 RepID=UPI0036E9F44B
MTRTPTVPRAMPPVDDSGAAPAPPSGRALLALARAESRRLLKHPALLVALAAYFTQWLYSAWWSDGDRYPVLHDESRFTQVTLLFLAAGTFLAVHLAVLRPARDAMTDLYETTVLEPWRRAAAHLLSVLVVVGLSTILVLARITYLATRPAAVGSPVLTELLTGPAVVLLAGTLAVLVGSLSRSTAAGPLTLAVLGVVTVTGALAGTSSWRWLTLMAAEDESVPPLPTDLMNRPAGLHALYLLFLAVLIAALVLIRNGQRGRTAKGIAVLMSAAVAVTAAAQLRPMPDSVVTARAEATTAPAPRQECVTEDPVTYCAFRGFKDRHRQWGEVTDGILRWVPDGGRSGPFFVRQRVYQINGGSGVLGPPPVDRWAEDDRKAGTPDAVTVGTRWGGGSQSDSSATIGFAASFAHRVTVEPSGTTPAMTRLCDARALVVTWLAAQATAETEDALREQLSSTFGGTGISFRPLDAPAGLRIERRSVETALSLLDRPATEVGPKVKESWAELTSPTTTLDRAAELLGVRAPAAGTEDEAAC